MDGTTFARRARRLLGTAFGLVALATPAAAQAQDVAPDRAFAVGSPAWTTAYDLAVARWGGVLPCNGRVDLRWQAMPDVATNAAASWRNPFSSYGRPDANTDCQILFNSAMWFDWEKFCTVLVHEVGHLMGQQHSPVDTDVMAAIYTAPAPECARTPEPRPVTAASTTTAQPAAAAPATTKATTKKAAKRKAAAKAKKRSRAKARAKKAASKRTVRVVVA